MTRSKIAFCYAQNSILWCPQLEFSCSERVMIMKRGRTVSATGFYHVFARGINHEVIFGQIREKKYFKKIVKKHLDKYVVEIYAYCIMPTHIHFIIKSENIQELSMFMSRILAEYAQYYNYKKRRNGHVFQGRYGSECIENEEYFWNCLRYVHLNPVKAHLTEKASDFPYSSMNDYIKERKVLLHTNALQMVKKRFLTWPEFEVFHQFKNNIVFLGVVEEIYEQRVEIAWKIIWELQEKHCLNHTCEVFEEPTYREEFFSEMHKKMLISSNLQNQIYNEIKKELIC